MSGPIHVLGIGGTFMGGLAQLAAAAGIPVSGVDENLYPPMDGQLRQAGIPFREGYRPEDLPGDTRIVVGNVMRRGMPVVEAMLDRGLAYTSGPQWLAERILQGRWVLAVAGTHGKTTTSSMLAFLLDRAGFDPGFLIGGVPRDFGVSARLGSGPFFVIEADEYDCAFFDKRAKFVHYRPRTLVLNNLEYDHADIYPDLAAIQRQFHHLLRTVPGQGLVLANAGDPALEQVLEQGCWTPVQRFGGGSAPDLGARPLDAQASSFEVLERGRPVGEVRWALSGEHNVANALAALGAARHAGVALEQGVALLAGFTGVRRRQELRGEVAGIRVIDDFAHHPTAIRLTLAGLRAAGGGGRLLVALEPRSNTMRMGVHADTLGASLAQADGVYLLWPETLDWSPRRLRGELGERLVIGARVPELVAAVAAGARPGDSVVVMSNGGFGGFHDALLQQLREKWDGGR
ncbi:UDP-N-acetylmuramate:L-alanyl-gamma-D-glutamyl-meso-diaminopimelate ligase [Thioalkalivibrio paradoxus]|uniref:UDP-N-acetylmuramate--L-alanyl-gamma-D-glutamyl-meso-2,6-diaminoheptandioate ligase n=1 Tax=Thioalkalivibrio paradoxus ARh 1 TaxID=713585 RepID=W0DLK4_9GAMM|nr:UDP-N-acetylmuramate:L-alanyl-gamma-D-glutamyl-meso-diaminopimelate ligase [Thioalkalivibrio paradoxus]AHE99321.1 UDP-N-acetylmuramate:L-alanyl-gamma-D-glutamyl-meso-diaminopimelate ligase [Thioalkalivibrio paradoxus ARh 1]